MPKITYKCVDCGKESASKYPSVFTQPESEYRCYDCAMEKRRRENDRDNNSKGLCEYKCIGCGKIRIAQKHKFKNIPPEKYRCFKCYMKTTRVERVTYKCIKCGSERTDIASNFNGKTSENYMCFKCAHKKMISDPIWIKNNKNTNSNPKLVKQRIEKLKIFYKSDLGKEKIENLRNNPIIRERNLITATGQGFWYGHPILSKERKYCELWNKDLWDRIDAAYDYKSILSGKTRFDNNNRTLPRHHLYWQEKACCEWDEDTQGYYAWILNNGEKVKYYIKGDPNKFVLLTDREHGIIKGRKGTTKDRIYYIKLIEDLIEERAKEGKKCYLSPEEYEVYKVEHADIIAKYKK